MPNKFKAIVINQVGENFSREVRELNFEIKSFANFDIKSCPFQLAAYVSPESQPHWSASRVHPL